ncbi:MAG TPA: ABC transporter ATP-binding protein [Alphaproteobacteria bacterium]
MSGTGPVPLLAVDELSIEFRTRSGTVHATERISLDLAAGEVLAVVGESGSGKSVTAYAVLGILDPAARVTSGRIMFQGQDLLHADEARLRRLRGGEIAMIFQNPRTALNPIRAVGRQIADVLERHAGVGRGEAARRATELLKKVKIPDAERRARAYPFELSGGMCQRVMIAMALSCRPRILIADEPTTGLDVTTQAVIMDLIDEVARDEGMSTLLITHDLALAAEHADRIAVMHAGHVVEIAPTETLLRVPRHPYTRNLIAAMPGPAPSLDALEAIPGALPDLRRSDLPTCRFSERCIRYQADCDQALPVERLSARHMVACRHPL